jgi:prephenate dehydratase
MGVDKIYVLGPEGTYSGYAARRYAEHLARAGQSRTAEISFTRSIPEALELASQSPGARAVAPIENSETGAVVATQDHLAKHGLFIEWEINVKIRFRLVSDVPVEEIARLYAHPVAFEQCDVFTAKRLRAAEVVFTRSNVDSGVHWANAALGEKAAAIVPSDYEPARSAAVLVADVQNSERNTTRFVVVRGGSAPGAAPEKAADFARAKTSLLIEPDADRPGLLFEILSVFKKHGINLCRIESRPARTSAWQYVFYMDITNNERTSEAVRELFAGPWNVVLLGTYDALPEG